MPAPYPSTPHKTRFPCRYICNLAAIQPIKRQGFGVDSTLGPFSGPRVCRLPMNRLVTTHLLLPFLLVTLLAAPGWALLRDRLVIDSSAETLLASDPRNQETFDKLHAMIPDTVMVMVALELRDLFSNEGAAIIAETSDRILSLPGCIEVKSLTHSGRPVRQGLGLVIEPFIPRYTSAAEWDELRTFNTSFPMSRNVLVSQDARYAILLGVFERDLPNHESREAFRREFMDALQALESRTERIHVLAFPFIEAEAYRALQQDLTRYLLLAGLLVFVVLMVTFRSVAVVCYVLLVETAGVFALMAIFLITARAIDLYTGILFPLVGGVQLTFVTHFAAALQRAGRTHPPRTAVALAFREVIGPSIIAALTTTAGLLTLGFSDLPMVADFGRIGAAGVLSVFVLTFVLPWVWSRPPAPADKNAAVPPSIAPWCWWPARHATAVIVTFTVLTAMMLLGTGRIRTDVRAVEFIHPDHPIRETLELINHELGGINLFQLKIDTGRPYGMQTLPVLRYLEDLRRYAYTLEGMTDAYAYSQLYVALNQLWAGAPSADGQLPESGVQLALFNSLLNRLPWLFKDQFVDQQAASSILLLRSRDMPGHRYLRMLEDFMAYAEANKPPQVTLTPVRGLHTLLEGDRQIVRNQTSTLGLSLGAIALLLSLLWTSPRAAAIVLLGNLPAMATLFGIMGYTGFPLNSVTVMVAAVVLGIAVDDGIHLVSAVRRERKRGTNGLSAVALALDAKVKPMACTSAILMVFLGLLVLASFPPVAHFGILAAAGLLTAFAGAVLLIPALLHRLHHPDSPPAGESQPPHSQAQPERNRH